MPSGVLPVLVTAYVYVTSLPLKTSTTGCPLTSLVTVIPGTKAVALADAVAVTTSPSGSVPWTTAVFTTVIPAGGTSDVTASRSQLNCHASPSSSRPFWLVSPTLNPTGGTGVAGPHLSSTTKTSTSGVFPGLVATYVDLTTAGGSRSPRTDVGVLALVSAITGW